MNKFWKFKDSVEGNGSDLYLEGEIANETWWGDEVTPKAFREELAKCNGKITVHLNSPGGDVFAGVSIYNALKDYAKKKKCDVIVKVDGLAASIASVVAMAGTEVIMAPGSMMMVHNPWSMGAGSAEELRKMADVLDEIKESVIPIYEEKTGKTHDEIEDIMDAETWMSAERAVELGFADTVKLDDAKEEDKMSLLAMRGNFAFNMSATKSAMMDLVKKVNMERNTAVDPEEEKKLAEDVEVKEDGTIEGTVDGEKVELIPDEETKKEIEEAEAEDAPADEAVAEETPAEDENAEEGEKDEDAEDKAVEEGEEIADKIEAEIKALREENAELKAKLEEAEARNAKASASLSAQNRLQARYAAILNMAEEADGGEVENGDEKTVDTYGNALSDAFKNL